MILTKEQLIQLALWCVSREAGAMFDANAIRFALAIIEEKLREVCGG